MSKKYTFRIIIGLSFILGVFVLAGCGPQGAMALRVTGNVASEEEWTEDQVKKMDTMDVEATNKDGETKTYTGVLIANLLNIAKPSDGATTVVFVADDGYTAEATLDEVMNCADCVVSFRDQGGFSIVMPDFSSTLQVKGVVEIQVK
jgi:hypothetical protein